jgi:putative PIN family toxin of toxin-antitoxin system
MMRLVLDTNVVVSGMLWRGAPRRLLELARTGDIQLFTSPELLSELEQTLGYAKLQTKVAASRQSVRDLVNLYARLASVVNADAIDPVVINDPDDDHVLACGLAARVAAIVSGDKHLLGLGNWRDIDIVSVPHMLRQLGDQSVGG